MEIRVSPACIRLFDGDFLLILVVGEEEGGGVIYTGI